MLRIVAMIAAALTTSVVDITRAAASDIVILRPGDVGEEKAFFESLLVRARAECFCDFQITDFQIGRFDVNDDGQYELFVSYGKFPFCGSFGCHNPVFQLQNGHWKPITELDGGTWTFGAFDTRPNRLHYVIAIIVADERFDSYRTLIGGEMGVQWSVDETTGEAGYHSFCLTPRCFWNLPSFPEAEPPKPAKRKRRRQ